MSVYIDVIWLLNFLVDSLLLWMTAIFLKRTVHFGRIFLGGLLGSLLVFLSITPLSFIAGHPVIKICISIGMILITFGFNRLKYFFAGLFTFYFSTFLMGGILIGVHYFLTFDMQLQSAVFLDSIRGFGDPISWMFVMAAFPVAWYFSRKRIDAITISNIEYSVLADVTIEMNGIVLKLKGLIDSGNQLYDPISKSPVMIVSAHNMEHIIPPEVLALANENQIGYETAAALPVEWSAKMRLIPAKTLGRNHQLLCAFKPDRITLVEEENMRVVKNGLIVFTSQKLSSDGTFQCIIHPQMAAGGVVQPAS